MTSQPFFAPSVVILLAAVPLLLRLTPRNRIYGVRTFKTLSDESICFRANRFGGWLFLASSAAYLAVAMGA